MTEGLDYMAADGARNHWRDRMQNELEWPQETFFYKDAVTIPKQGSQNLDTIYQHSKFPSWDESDTDLWRINRIPDSVEAESHDNVTSNSSKTQNNCDAICRKFICWFLVFTLFTSGCAGVVLFFLLRTPNQEGQLSKHHDNHIHQHLTTSEQQYLTNTFCDIGKLLLKGADYPTDVGVASCHTAFSLIENSEEIHIEMHLSPAKGFTVKEKLHRALMEQILVDGLYRINGTETFLQTDGTVFDPSIILKPDKVPHDQYFSTSAPHTTSDTAHMKPHATPTTRANPAGQCKCYPKGTTVVTETADNQRSNVQVRTTGEGNVTADQNIVAALKEGNRIDNIVIPDKREGVGHITNETLNKIVNITVDRKLSENKDTTTHIILERDTVVNYESTFQSRSQASKLIPTSTRYSASQFTSEIDISTSLADYMYDYYWETSTAQLHNSPTTSANDIQPSTPQMFISSTDEAAINPRTTPFLQHTHALYSAPNIYFPDIESNSYFNSDVFATSTFTTTVSKSIRPKVTLSPTMSYRKDNTRNILNDLHSTTRIFKSSAKSSIDINTPDTDTYMPTATNGLQDVNGKISSRKPVQYKTSLSEQYTTRDVLAVSHIGPSSVIPVYMSTTIPDQENKISLFKSEKLTIPFDISNQLDISLSVPNLNEVLRESSNVIGMNSPTADISNREHIDKAVSSFSEAASTTIPPMWNSQATAVINFDLDNSARISMTTPRTSAINISTTSQSSEFSSENITNTADSGLTNPMIVDNQTITNIADLLHKRHPIIIPAIGPTLESNIPNDNATQPKYVTLKPDNIIIKRVKQHTDFKSIQKQQIRSREPSTIRNLPPIHTNAHVNTASSGIMQRATTGSERRASQNAERTSQMNVTSIHGTKPQPVRAYNFFDHFNPLQVLMKMPGMNFQFG